MILVDLEIENYKQFAGAHRITFPAEGAIAVIGHNGAGKTTLFEAIEWALYGPRSIPTADIRPRQGTGGSPCVRVTLQTSDGKRFQVERKLRGKSNSAEAAIYEVDEDGEILSTIVTGPKDVTQRVAGRLVGLSHQAFVSTFFTRQKELSFFGDQKDSDRRRQVSRLLGQETIREAQELIATDRKGSDATAKGLMAQFVRETEGRDFPAERAERTAQILAAEGQVETSGQAVAARTRDRQLTQEAELHWRKLERKEGEFRQRMTVVDGQIGASEGRIEQIGAQLTRLASREAELERLEPIASREAEHQTATERWQRERERAARQQTLTQRLAEIGRNRDGRIVTLRRVVDGGEVVPGWVWQSGDERQPAVSADRLQAVASAIDLRRTRAYAEATARAAQASADHDAARKKAGDCDKLLAQLRSDLDALFVDGDPAALAVASRQRQAAAATEWASASAQAKALSVDVGKLRGSIRQLREEGSGTCPTCKQPIDEIVIRTLEGNISEFERQVAGLERDATTGRRLDAEAGTKLAAAQARQEQVSTLRERIRNGETRTAEAKAAHEATDAALREALAKAGTHEVPSAETVAAAGQRVERLSRVAAQADRLGDIATQFRDDDAREAENRQELDALGVVAYDEAAHRTASTALGASQGARGQVGEIRNELAQRPALTTDRDTAVIQLAARRDDRTRLEGEHQAVGFDPDALASALARARAANDAQIAANDALNEAKNLLRDATAALAAIEAEQQRLAGLEVAARAAERDADQLKEMYDGFTDFEKWVAQQMNPHLADRASEILNEVTGGAYDRVRFDENYGLHIYDNDEDFPVSQFSGGERDVASLAARLALSRLIGAQAAHPPAFVVLDEVFGSLDQERRGKLLGMLDALTNDDTEGFRQLFVISHVDDIRQSQAFDEVWRIQEDGQGISQWENMQLTGGIEEL